MSEEQAHFVAVQRGAGKSDTAGKCAAEGEPVEKGTGESTGMAAGDAAEGERVAERARTANQYLSENAPPENPASAPGAFGASVLVWRYDPVSRVMTDTATFGRAFGLPRRLENVPESLLARGLVHPDSVEAFCALFAPKNGGVPRVREVRLRVAAGRCAREKANAHPAETPCAPREKGDTLPAETPCAPREKAAREQSAEQAARANLPQEKTAHDGEYRRLRIVETPLSDAAGCVCEEIGSAVDLTDRIETERRHAAELEHALALARAGSRAKSAFLSRVSHDMRTPLNGILGLAALMRQPHGMAELQEDVTQLELSGKYLLALIGDTLDASRLENARLALHPAVCEGTLLFKNTLTLVQPELLKKKLRLHVDAARLPAALLYVDAGRIEQLIMNILSNAVKFTPEGGRIDFVAAATEETAAALTVCVTVRDSGIGMSAAFLPHLFEPFSQEDTARTSRSTGTGLGMAIAKRLVELMNGEISVESAPGRGTSVSCALCLPKATAVQAATWRAAHGYEAAAQGGHLAGRRVLLCEDHPLNTRIAVRLLERKGIAIDTAADGREGVEKFRASPLWHYDAVLMDIRMPVLDGLAAAKAIRALPRPDAAVPILAVTANALHDDVEAARAAGMDAHIAKPIEPELLYAALAKSFQSPHTGAVAAMP